ncbi:putative F-box protein At3g52320 [Silene latifolia]|uniref:putative F-box protein At3g52320 n=1 Tax=Silene latifolia TaxID=37657 RepID=UPI003D77EB48
MDACKVDASNADIPEEIQIDILSRLPPESLSRFKRVSKHWYTTLTIQAFLIRHSLSYDKHPKLGFALRSRFWEKKSIISFELNDDNTPKTTGSLVRVKDVYFIDFLMNYYSFMSNICNDLICLVRNNRQFSTSFFSLLNIKTREFTQLPAITNKSVITSRNALGFDPVHKVFKVLSIIYKRTGEEYAISMVAVLTVGSKYWNPIEYKSLPSSLTKNFFWFWTESVCLNGVIYWVLKSKINNFNVLTVVAFDLSREAFRDIELVTRHAIGTIFRYYLTSLKECPTLLIWNINKDDDTEEVEQWTLFDHKNPNAAWKRRNFTDHNFPITVRHGSHDIPAAGGSTLLQYSERINSECCWYLSYDLENFAIE